MTEPIFLSSGFEDLIRAAVQPTDPQPETLDRIWLAVRRETANSIQKQPSPRGRTFLYATAAVLVILVIAVLVISPQRVLAEMRRFFEVFVPGYGFVQEESSLRMIVQPVRLERGGSWDTIEQAFTDSTRTLIIPGERHFAGELNSENCVDTGRHAPYLTMFSPAGEELRLDLSEKHGGLIFPPIPPDIQDVTLVMNWTWPCMHEPDWEFPLHFQPAPPGAAIPVIAVEEVAPTPDLTPASDAAEAAPTAPAGPVLSLKKVIETGDGYIFGGTLAWEENPATLQRYDMPMTDALRLVDAGQNSFVVENTNPYDLQMSDTEPRENELGWAYQVNAAGLSSPLTLTVPTLIKFVYDPGRSMAFQLDFGANPSPGLAWGADRQFEMDGKKFKLTKLEYRIDPAYPDYQEVRYTFLVDPGIRSIFIDSFCPDQAPEPGSMGGGGGSSGTVDVMEGVLTGYASLPVPPTGVCTFNITGIEYEDLIPWQISIPLPGK